MSVLKSVTLKDTVDLMISEDYKDRFLAEYNQAVLRAYKLKRMLIKLEAGTLDFTPKCPASLLIEQLEAMRQYIYILEVRAETEGISLE